MESETRGRILRIKAGYNPNSSSVGSLIPKFLFLALGTGALTITVLGLVSAVDRKLRKGAPEAGSPHED